MACSLGHAKGEAQNLTSTGMTRRKPSRMKFLSASGGEEGAQMLLNNASRRSAIEIPVGCEGDIKGFFDNISHQWLLDDVLLNKSILQRWLESGYLEKQVFFDRISGHSAGRNHISSAGQSRA